MKSILIVGASSKIGSYFKLKFNSDNYKIYESSRSKSINNFYLDLEYIDEFLDKDYRFDYVVIFSAITVIKQCEKDPEKCFLINTTNTKKLVEYFVNKNSYVLCFSTDNVFNGSRTNYNVSEKKSPRSVYGRSKALLEDELKKYLDKICILRMTKVIDGNNKLFKNWLVDLSNNIEIFPYHDTFISPISIDYLSEILVKIIKLKIVGIQQVSSYDQVSYSDIAEFLCRSYNFDQNLIKSISCKESLQTNCPKFSSLKSTVLDFHKLKVNSYDSIRYFVNQQ